MRGSGRVELAAYGVADAEHQVEKELRAAWPDARVTILQVARTGSAPRIVEEFVVAYALRGTVSVDVASDDPADLRRSAFRLLRDRFAGTRHARIAWDATG